MTTRAEWQQLAEDRILDAQAHLAVARWSGAYYLIGYAVECGLKSCVVARVGAHPEVIYQERRFSQDAWTHDFENLLVVADIKVDLYADAATNVTLENNWQRVSEWTERARYLQKTKAEAERLFEAVTDPKEGVMQWIRQRW